MTAAPLHETSLQPADLLTFSTDFPHCLWDQMRISRRKDLILRVGGDDNRPTQDFAANSDIVMARSKYLREAVPVKGSDTDLHPVVRIPDMTPEQFAPYFQFMHTDSMECFLTVNQLVDGLYAGKTYKTDSLVERCRERL